MATLNNVVFLKDGEEFNLGTFPDGIFAVFTGSIESKYATTMIAAIEETYKQANEAKLSVFFATKDSIECDSKSVLLDEAGEITALCGKLCKRSGQCNALLIFTKKGNEITHVLSRENPELEYEWVDFLIGYTQNYLNPQPDATNHWRVGQIVTEQSDYMCIDCGYIMTLPIGSLFPVCEVCFSGDPDGPTDGPEQGYWEKI
jgi:hypothetical protein